MGCIPPAPVVHSIYPCKAKEMYVHYLVILCLLICGCGDEPAQGVGAAQSVSEEEVQQAALDQQKAAEEAAANAEDKEPNTVFGKAIDKANDTVDQIQKRQQEALDQIK